ncbi:MAG: hypothetical protein ACRCYO_16785 [Bacteroidia bacterium]
MEDVLVWVKIILLFVFIIGLIVLFIGAPIYVFNRLQNKHFKLLATELGFSVIHLPKPRLLTTHPHTSGYYQGSEARVAATTTYNVYQSIPNHPVSSRNYGLLAVRLLSKKFPYRNFKLHAKKRISEKLATRPHELNADEYFQFEVDGQVVQNPLPEKIIHALIQYTAVHGRNNCIIHRDKEGFLLMAFSTQVLSEKKRKLVKDSLDLLHAFS